MNKEAIRICWGYDDICRAVAYRDAAYFGKGEVRIFLHSEPGEIPHAVLFRYDREKHPQYSRMDEAELSRCAETEDALTKLTVSKHAVADAVLAWEYQGRRPTGVRFEGSGESIRAALLFAPERDAAQVLPPSFRAAPGELARRFSLNEPLFTASVESDGCVCAIFGSRVLRFPWERGWEAAELLDFSGAYTRLTMIHPLSGEYLVCGDRREPLAGIGEKEQHKYAHITDERGTLHRFFFLGGTPCRCRITSDNRILCGYYDEQIYAPGTPQIDRAAVLWDDRGKRLWHYERAVAQCSAIHIMDGALWIVTDGERIERIDSRGGTEIPLPLQGIRGFAAGEDGEHFLFAHRTIGEKSDRFTLCRRGKREFTVEYALTGAWTQHARCSAFSGSRFLVWDENFLYGLRLM